MRKNVTYLVITGILLLVYSCNFSKKEDKMVSSCNIVDFELLSNKETILMSDL